jgi:hypothetical protein
VEKIDKALREAFLKEKDANEFCELPESQYMNQMKEVLAFMGVEDYHTYRVALEIDEQIKSLNSNQSVTTLTKFIDDAVEKLVPPSPSQIEQMEKDTKKISSKKIEKMLEEGKITQREIEQLEKEDKILKLNPNPNQFYDVALTLLQEKRKLYEENYEFEKVSTTLGEQKERYQQYKEEFISKKQYC